jgi:hypothetical protein
LLGPRPSPSLQETCGGRPMSDRGRTSALQTNAGPGLGAADLDDSVMVRLQEQIAWYSRKSLQNQRWFKTLKILQLLCAALIPVLAAASISTVVAAVLGALILVLEGLQQMNQYQQNWISYRATSEALKHEKYLYLALAGPYGRARDARALLAERVESLVSQEQAKWVSTREEAARRTDRDSDG